MSPEAGADARERWEVLLDALEADTGRAATGRPLAPWAPPADMPALPAALRPRAERLLSAQAEVRARLAATQAETGRRLALLRRAGAARATSASPRRPVYVDAVG